MADMSEPIESELAVQVEYDMDEQGESRYLGVIGISWSLDQEWLDSVNAERQKEQSGPISYEVFEIIMDKLEKEWFNLVRPHS
jgi:NuA3 HAT complex component NTO1